MTNENDDLENLFDGINLNEADVDWIGALANKEAMLQDDFDFGAFDRVDVSEFGASTVFLRMMVEAGLAEWRRLGKYTYTCILQWRHSRVTTNDLERFVRAVRTSYSRFRIDVPRSSLPKLIQGKWQIHKNQSAILLVMYFMDDENWLLFNRENPRSAKAKRSSGQATLNKLLSELLAKPLPEKD